MKLNIELCGSGRNAACLNPVETAQSPSFSFIKEINTGLFCVGPKGMERIQQGLNIGLSCKVNDSGLPSFLKLYFIFACGISYDKRVLILHDCVIIEIDALGGKYFGVHNKTKWTQSIIVLTKSAFSECLVFWQTIDFIRIIRILI